jgi:hypothetical protein
MATTIAIAPTSDDKTILDAFEARRSEFAAHYHLTDMPKEQEDAYFERISAQEAVIYQTPANTIPGVIAKLRIEFMHHVGTDWSDHAIMDPATPVFVKGLADADWFTRQAWSAIEDLTKIAGTTSSEWTEALARVEKEAATTRAAMKAFNAIDAIWCADPTNDPATSRAWDEAWKTYCEEGKKHTAELRNLIIMVPAPNAAAAMTKAQILLDSGLQGDDLLAQHLANDLRRFSNYANQEA